MLLGDARRVVQNNHARHERGSRPPGAGEVQLPPCLGYEVRARRHAGDPRRPAISRGIGKIHVERYRNPFLAGDRECCLAGRHVVSVAAQPGRREDGVGRGQRSPNRLRVERLTAILGIEKAELEALRDAGEKKRGAVLLAPEGHHRDAVPHTDRAIEIAQDAGRGIGGTDVRDKSAR